MIPKTKHQLMNKLASDFVKDNYAEILGKIKEWQICKNINAQQAYGLRKKVKELKNTTD